MRPAISALAAAFIISACSQEDTYDVRGRVAGFGDDAHTVLVEHETIPGYMPGMTMPFQAADSAALGDLEVGDAISFELVVNNRSARIQDIAKLPDDALPEHPAGTPVPQSSGTPDLIAPGDSLPNARLVTHADTSLSLSELKGKPVLLTFIYASCPVPDYCPLMSRNFAEVQDSLASLQGAPVHLVSVSFDPANDTPSVLREYAARYTDDLSSWTFATGDSAQVRKLAERFGVFYTPDDEQIVHNLVTVLAGADGVVREVWRGNDWTPQDVLDALRHNDAIAV